MRKKSSKSRSGSEKCTSSTKKNSLSSCQWSVPQLTGEAGGAWIRHCSSILEEEIGPGTGGGMIMTGGQAVGHLQ